MKAPVLIIMMIVIAFVSACSNEVKKNERPGWIDNPEPNFVGKCATHVRGLIAQEECAYKKGLAYIAMSKGVSVDVTSDMTIKQTATEKTGSSFGQVQATVRMDENNIRVSGSIIEKWHDRTADILYVLIREN